MGKQRLKKSAPLFKSKYIGIGDIMITTKTQLTIANFNSGEFPAEQTEFFHSLEILQKKIDNKLVEFRLANPEEQSTQELKLRRANLNKLYKFVNEARKKMKNEWDFKLNAYTDKFAQMIEGIVEAKNVYDKTFDARQAAEKHYKKSELKSYFNDINVFGTLLSFDEIMDDDWLNKTYDIEKAKKDICEIITKIKQALEQIEHSELQPGLKKFCKIRLFETLNLDTAMAETCKFGEKLSILNNL